MMKESEMSGESAREKNPRFFERSATLLRAMSAQRRGLAPKNAAALVVETMERYSQPNDAVAA